MKKMHRQPLILSTALGLVLVAQSAALAASVKTNSVAVEKRSAVADASKAASGSVSTTASKKKQKLPAAFAAKEEAIVVTGSALATRADSNANPVQTITAQQIQQTSATNLGDYLLRLPSIGSTGTNNTNTNGGLGMSCTDIRNLGQSRVLVLIDGKRQVSTFGSGSQCVDLNSIPMDQIMS
ncbi:MAG: TonB-dependent receptor plug domain-containing protein, partial [Acetobacter sp.]|nr:TonB-dependent receptor plug domain-containing protein [Acetobacter sp.]